VKVYMGGLIYLTGCGDDVRAYAPKEKGHHASLWIEALALDAGQTTWWPGLRHADRMVGNVAVVEFEIPEGAEIWFPGEGEVDCKYLEDGLPKLKMKKKKANDDDLDHPEEDFEVDLNTAQVNAVIDIREGKIRPRSTDKDTLIEWTIQDPGLAIVAKLANDTKTITLNSAGADVVFLNSHDLPDIDGEQDAFSGNHVAAFRNLNPNANVKAYPVAAKDPKRAKPFNNSSSSALVFIANSGCTCGAGTPCCC